MNPNVFESLNKFKNIFADPIVAALKQGADPHVISWARERSKELTSIIS